MIISDVRIFGLRGQKLSIVLNLFLISKIVESIASYLFELRVVVKSECNLIPDNIFS